MRYFKFKQDIGMIGLPSRKQINTALYMDDPFPCEGDNARSLSRNPFCVEVIGGVEPVIETPLEIKEVNVARDVEDTHAILYGYNPKTETMSAREYFQAIKDMYRVEDVAKMGNIPTVDMIILQANNYKETRKCTFRNEHLDIMLEVRGNATTYRNKSEKLFALAKILAN